MSTVPTKMRASIPDFPNVEMHRLDSGHFAVEDCLDELASNMSRFYIEKVAKISA